MRAKKQFDSFLSANIYDRFEEKNLSVEEFLSFEDNAERAAKLDSRNSGHYMINILR